MTRGAVFSAALMVSLGFITLGGLGVANEGFAKRFGTDLQQLSDSAAHSPIRTRCHASRHHPISPEQACQYPVEGGSWAVFGDSHGVELAYALGEALGREGEGVRHFTMSACGPDGRGKVGCRQWFREALPYVAADPAIKRVVLSYRLNLYLFGEHYERYPLLPDDYSDAHRDAVWQGLIDVSEQLLAAGKTVVVVLQPPELPVEMTRLFYKYQAGVSGLSIEGVPLNWWQQRNAYVLDRVSELPAQVRVINPAAWLCDEQSCYGAEGNTSLYFDSDHLSLEGAERVVQRILSAPETKAH